jgi:hypothetical protein
MTLQFQQTDSPSVYSGQGLTGQPANAGGTVDRLCSVTPGTPGSQVNTVTLDAWARDLYTISWDLAVPAFTLWQAGRWTVRLNVQLANASVTWNRCYLYRLNASGVVQSLIGALFRVPQVLTAPGVKAMTVPGEAQPTRSYGDRVVCVLTLVNQGTQGPANVTINSNVPQTFSFVASELVDTPLTGGNV